jgi:lipid II isoglutaminyl synthase (glutamine-hydrolysing)
MELHLVHLYPRQMNLYGDRGNILCLMRRCEWRGITPILKQLDIGETLDPDWGDLYMMGGGQDRQQLWVADDLHQSKASLLQEAVTQQAVLLGICGGYQLFGHYYKPHDGPELKGLSLMDVTTVAGHNRLIGNIVIERNGETIVGFENHSGLTHLGADAQPLGKVIAGHGNTGLDKTEGAVQGSVYGTYLHGSLLPKNPALADELITLALHRRYGPVALTSLGDDLEKTAHQSVRQMVHA